MGWTGGSTATSWRSSDERPSPASQTSAPGRWLSLLQTGPSPNRIRRAVDPGREYALDASAPSNVMPGRVRRHRLGFVQLLVRHGLTSTACGRQAPHVGPLDLPVPDAAHHPMHTSRIQAVPEGDADIVARIVRHRTEP